MRLKTQSKRRQTDLASEASGNKLKARQLFGHPAGPGIAKGKARMIRQHAEQSYSKNGEVLVGGAVDPNITFVMPLASAMVGGRVGMLLQVTIIAREYSLPHITGIPEVTTLIKTGDEMTIDGYLGIFTLG